MPFGFRFVVMSDAPICHKFAIFAAFLADEIRVVRIGRNEKAICK